jgi:hypothetical protein
MSRSEEDSEEDEKGLRSRVKRRAGDALELVADVVVELI